MESMCACAGHVSGVFPPSGLDWGRLSVSVVSLLYEQSSSSVNKHWDNTELTSEETQLPKAGNSSVSPAVPLSPTISSCLCPLTKQASSIHSGEFKSQTDPLC